MHLFAPFLDGQQENRKGVEKYDWEKEFQFIVRQFDEGEVAHLDDQTYDPIF